MSSDPFRLVVDWGTAVDYKRGIMFGILLVLFILVPLGELWLLFTIADLLGEGGGGLTFLIVVITGMIGASLAKGQGIKVWLAIQKDLAESKMPTDHLLSGLLVLIGGVLLVTPGVVTDLVGLFLMIPGNRRLLSVPIKNYFARRIHIHTMGGPFQPAGAEKEAESVEIVDEDAP